MHDHADEHHQQHEHAAGEADHEHGHGHGHHEHPPPDPALLELLEGLEYHTLHSVGVDIGSSTSHLVMSRLVIQRRGSDLSAEFVVSKRETLYRSPIWLTPYRPGGTAIDTDRLRSLFEDAYRAAGIWPKDVDTGAVVITGEALKKENAEQIARMTADWSGVFITVSAGPNHEALLAAHGSGSVALSEDGARTVVNVDIGGGTTKISVVDDGLITHVEAFSVGARLLAFDQDGRIGRLEEPARVLLDRLGRGESLGDVLDPGVRAQVADLMAAVIVGVLTGAPDQAELHAELRVASDDRPLPTPAAIDHVVFSGGVSEFLSSDPPTGFGDLGAELGAALRTRINASPLADKVHPAAQGIRATVLGASQFTVQASGQTCFVSDPGFLPVTGLQAVQLDFRAGPSEQAVRAALRQHDLTNWHDGLAAVVSFGPTVDYRTLRGAAEALVQVAVEHNPKGPLFVVLRQDLAHSLGGVLSEELGWAGPITVVDGINVGDLDHIDIGPPLGISGSLPVTVTSLEFPRS
ncbi:MAG TPA: ethanolamine ammonia-lyase reactivating factor EutA [Pseudonocardiaceae bacterium]|nr:ethanolamine ammonia-lyase reactivating factor EutA [Pseudonocardiaceae bacterium]